MPDPIPGDHLTALTILCGRLPLSTVNWALTGSLGHRLQGVDVSVNDIDLQTDAASTMVVAEALAEYVITLPRPRESERISSIFGTLVVAGVPVEVMGGLRKRTGPNAAWGPPSDPAAHRVLVRHAGMTVPVLSLAYEADAYAAIGRPERAALLRAAALGNHLR